MTHVDKLKAIQRILDVDADGIPGPKTESAWKALCSLLNGSVKFNGPSWMAIAEKELGVQEVPGSGNNPRILEYHDATSLSANQDSVAWCSSFCNWVLKKAGKETTNSAMARSFLNYGKPATPQRGAIVVFKRGNPPSGHVAFYLETLASGRVRVIGGNQSDRVCIADYPTSDVLAYRWPV